MLDTLLTLDFNHTRYKEELSRIKNDVKILQSEKERGKQADRHVSIMFLFLLNDKEQDVKQILKKHNKRLTWLLKWI